MQRVMVTMTALIVAATLASGAVIPLQQDSLDNLLGAGYIDATGLLISPVSGAGVLDATLYSQAFTDGAGLFAYVYQVENTGVAGMSVAEMFTIYPFLGADASVVMGSLTGTIPAGFFGGPAQEPWTSGYVDALTGGPQLSFYYNLLFGRSIDPGEFSDVMFVMSTLPPGLATGNIIGASVASGPVVAPVPEPATMLLAAGAAALLGLKRRL